MGHRKHIDELVDLVKQEMALLNEVDKPGSDVDQYIQNLDKLLLTKIDMMHQIRQQLIEFNKNIKTEETMSKLYQQQQNLDVLDADIPNGNEYGDEEMLMAGDEDNQNMQDDYF